LLRPLTPHFQASPIDLLLGLWLLHLNLFTKAETVLTISFFVLFLGGFFVAVSLFPL